MIKRSVRAIILALGCFSASRAQGEYLGGMVLDKQTAKPLYSCVRIGRFAMIGPPVISD